MGRSEMWMAFDSRLHDDVYGTTDNNEMLHVIAANEIELPLRIDCGGFDYTEPLFAAPAGRARTLLPEEGPERPDQQRQKRDSEENPSDDENESSRVDTNESLRVHIEGSVRTGELNRSLAGTRYLAPKFYCRRLSSWDATGLARL